MVLLHEVDKPNSNVDTYVENLDNILNHKLSIISSLKSMVNNFRDHLK